MSPFVRSSSSPDGNDMTLLPARRSRLAALGLVAATAVLLAGCSTASADGDDSGAGGPSLLPAAEGTTEYPLTIETGVGEITIEERPERIVMASSWDADLFAALGVTPVGTDDQIDFYPWVLETFPEEIESVWTIDEVPYPAEPIAATEPDLIVDLFASDAASVEQVSEIAGFVGSPATDGGETVWQERILLLGEVLDLSARAQDVVDQYDTDFETLRAEHPEFEGKTVDYVVYWGEEYGTGFQNTTGSDAEAIFSDMGFAVNPAAGEAAFEDVLSDELLGTFAADVLVISNQALPEEFDEWWANPLIQGLPAVQSGQVVVMDLAQEDFTVSYEGEPTGFVGHLGRAFSLGPLSKLEVANLIAPLVAAKLA